MLAVEDASESLRLGSRGLPPRDGCLLCQGSVCPSLQIQPRPLRRVSVGRLVGDTFKMTETMQRGKKLGIN
jgi:hypothetical protein